MSVQQVTVLGLLCKQTLGKSLSVKCLMQFVNDLKMDFAVENLEGQKQLVH